MPPNMVTARFEVTSGEMYRDFQQLMVLATDVISLGLDTEGCLRLQKLLAVVRAGILEAVSFLAEAKRDLNNSNESFKSLSSPEMDTLSLHSSVRSCLRTRRTFQSSLWT